MRTAALLATTGLVLALTGCGLVPRPGEAGPAPEAAAPTSTTAPVAPTAGPSAAPTSIPTATAPTASTSVAHDAPPAQARLQDVVGARGEAVPDPQYLLEATVAHTTRATSYRLGVNGAPGSGIGFTGTVDVSDPRTPRADVYAFDRKAHDGSLHLVLVGDTVYTRFPQRSAKFARTPLAEMPKEIRRFLEAYVDPSAVLESSGDGIRIDYTGVDTNRDPEEHLFKVVADDGRPAYEHTSWSDVAVDPELRLRSVADYEDGSVAATLLYSEYGTAARVEVPPARLVEDVPGRAWERTITA